MNIPEDVYDIPFCVVYPHKEIMPVIVHCKDPEELHKEFDKVDKTLPAYALNFGLIVRSQNI